MMPDGPVHIVDAGRCSTTLKAAASARRYTLRGMPGEDFPRFAEPAQSSPTLALELDVLSKLIRTTHFSISTDETRAHAEQRALRVGRRPRSHGHHRRSPPFEDGS